MTFLAPWLLLGLLSVAVPLVLHLRRSRRTQRIVFSTTQFFDEAFLRSARRARIQDLLLMILRMAVLAFFVLALAQPLVRGGKLAAVFGVGGGARQVGIVLDDSASMGERSGKGVHLARAKEGALGVLEGLSEARGDRATVILAGRRETGSRVLFAEASGDLEAVRGAIREVTATDLATDLGGAIRAGAEALGVGEGSGGSGPRGRREIIVFSDFQESGLAEGELSGVGERATLALVGVRPEGAPTGVSVDVVQYGAARPLAGAPFGFRTMVVNHSEAPVSVRVGLVVDGETVSEKEVEIGAGRGRIVRFTHRFARRGWRGGSVLAAAGGGAESRRHFALFVEDRLRVLAINGAPSEIAAKDELFFFRLALAARGGEAGEAPIAVDEAGPAVVSAERLRGYPLAVLANVGTLTAEGLEALEHYVDQGGNLFITLGDRVQEEAYNAWTGGHRLHGGLLPGRLLGRARAPSGEADVFSEESEEAGFIAAVDEKHPALAGFGTGELGSLSSVRFTQRYALAPGDAEVLMRGPGGEPVMLERRFGRGRVVLFASTIDRDWTNFPLEPTYVPWLYRVLAYLGRQEASRANFARTGQVVELAASTTAFTSLAIEKPDGEMGYAEVDVREAGATVPDVFTETERAGVYTVRAAGEGDAGEPVLMFAANTPPEEWERWYLEGEELEGLATSGAAVVYVDDVEALAHVGTPAGQGYGLWDVLLGLALVGALVEPWVANRLSKRRAAPMLRASGAREARELAVMEARESTT